MKKALKNAVKKIKDGGNKYGITFEFEKTEDKDSFIITNRSSQKAALIGQVDLHGQEILVSFLINVHKWAWAEAEGFTRSEIVDKFSKEVFTEIDVEEIAENLV